MCTFRDKHSTYTHTYNYTSIIWAFTLFTCICGKSIRIANLVVITCQLIWCLSSSFIHAAQRIVGISTNFRIGFGSFVDKRLGPYVNLRPEVQDNPCSGNSQFSPCVPTYSYRHVVSLTPDENLFNVSFYSVSYSPSLPPRKYQHWYKNLITYQSITPPEFVILAIAPIFVSWPRSSCQPERSANFFSFGQYCYVTCTCM